MTASMDPRTAAQADNLIFPPWFSILPRRYHGSLFFYYNTDLWMNVNTAYASALAGPKLVTFL